MTLFRYMSKKVIGKTAWVVLLIFSAGFVLVEAAPLEVISRPWTNVPHAFGLSSGIQLSTNGQWAVFNSSANGLSTNIRGSLNLDVFLRNTATGENILISRTR